MQVRSTPSALFCASLLAVAGIAQADTVFTINLTQDQEPAPTNTTPPTTSGGGARPQAFGTATFTLNDAQTELSMTATITNIDVNGTQTPNDTNDNLTAAHIHVGALNAGGTAPVRWGFFGAPDNDTNPDNLVVTPFATGAGGTFTSIWNQPEGNAGTTLTSNLPDILAGRAYLNFHTVQFGGGEIRGQLPEPASMAALTGIGVGLLVRRRRA